jgi:hypothetical protein
MIASTGFAVEAFFVCACSEGCMEGYVLKDEVKGAAERALQYIHSCQTEDGGYFFARIPPGSLRDSYFAVKALRLLSRTPQQAEAVERFVWAFLRKIEDNPVHTSYLAIEILNDLGKDLEALRHQSEAIEAPLAALDRVSDPSTLYIEVVSELEQVFEAVSVLLYLGIQFNRKAVVEFIGSLSNKDGGFGSRGHSSLATTYYAVKTLATMAHPRKQSEHVLSFLRTKEQEVYFLEDLYYLSSACSMLGKSLSEPERAISFVLGCQRDCGGFARAKPMGIATLEDTYYAISILKQLNAL